MTTVRRLVVNSIDDIQVETINTPPGPGELLVRRAIVGVCGSDMHDVHGRHPFMSLPFWRGHEVVGVVEATGDDIDPRLAGLRVVIEPNLACGHCDQRLATLDVFGYQTPGA